MIRPPSNIRAYDDFYSGDPAIIQPEVDATPEQRAERDRLIRVARETGDWAPITVSGQQPTKFVMLPSSGDAYRTMIDSMSSDKYGHFKMSQIAFRLAVKAIENFGNLEVKRNESERYGEIATVKVSDALDAVDKKIVTELGQEAMRRASAISPKL